MARHASRLGFALNHDHVGDAQLMQRQRRAEAGRPAADDYDIDARARCGGHWLPSQSLIGLPLAFAASAHTSALQ